MHMRGSNTLPVCHRQNYHMQHKVIPLHTAQNSTLKATREPEVVNLCAVDCFGYRDTAAAESRSLDVEH